MKKIELSYQKNVRDLGGLVGFEGKKVKEGKIYRGGFLGRVSNEDILKINSLKLTDIIDFRSAVEYINRPDYVFMGVTYHNFPALIDNENLKTKAEYDDSNLLWFLDGSTDGKLHMKKTYEEVLLSKDGVEAFRNFFKVLTQDENRVVYYHCSQGKDRAGLASYLVEIALGVSEEDAVKDYLLTNEAMKTKIKHLKSMLKNKPFYNKDYARALEEVFVADLEYLNYGLNRVKEECGSIENYLVNILQVDINKLRKYYLE